jgi:hypothetical protein
MSKTPLRSLAAVCAVFTLAGVTSINAATVAVGADGPAVIVAMGKPKARHTLPGGAVRLVYPRGPAGKGTTMVDLGADGRVTSVREVLGEKQFAALPIGMTEDELLREIGPPSERQQHRDKTTTWGYRYPTTLCLWYTITIGADRRMQGGSYGVDPVCDPSKGRK